MPRTRRSSLAAGAAGLALVFALTPAARVQAQDPAVADRLDALERGQKQIQQQLAEIKKLVEGQAQPAAAPAGPAVAGVEFDLGDNPVKGVLDARLVLVEFTDYQ